MTSLHAWLTIAAIVLMPLAITQETLAEPQLKLPDGSTAEAAYLPFFKARPNVVGHLEKVVSSGRQNDMAFATTPAFCPRYSYMSWGGEDPETRAAGRCQTRVDKLLRDYSWPSSMHGTCMCVLAIKNMEVLDKSVLMRGTRFTPAKLFIRNREGTLTQREGFLEYEKTSW